MQSVALGDPDEALVETVLVKLFIDRQLDAGEEVVRFLMARMPRSVTAARHVAAAIDRAALTARRRQITLPLARAALPELEANEARSEEHTSELQSLIRSSYAVFCLKKNITINK